MKSYPLLAIGLGIDAAAAHETMVPHGHAHGISALPDLYLVLAAFVVVAIGYAVRHMMKWGRTE
jgi:hypothetical protein